MRTPSSFQPSFWDGPAGHGLIFFLWMALILVITLLHARMAL